jgi:hypothetical protein
VIWRKVCHPKQLGGLGIKDNALFQFSVATTLALARVDGQVKAFGWHGPALLIQ